MKESLIDTDILSYYMRGNSHVPYGDLFIGATALTHNLILVTNNTGHFSKIEGLILENWMES